MAEICPYDIQHKYLIYRVRMVYRVGLGSIGQNGEQLHE